MPKTRRRKHREARKERLRTNKLLDLATYQLAEGLDELRACVAAGRFRSGARDEDGRISYWSLALSALRWKAIHVRALFRMRVKRTGAKPRAAQRARTALDEVERELRESEPIQRLTEDA